MLYKQKPFSVLEPNQVADTKPDQPRCGVSNQSDSNSNFFFFFKPNVDGTRAISLKAQESCSKWDQASAFFLVFQLNCSLNLGDLLQGPVLFRLNGTAGRHSHRMGSKFRCGKAWVLGALKWVRNHSERRSPAP